MKYRKVIGVAFLLLLIGLQSCSTKKVVSHSTEPDPIKKVEVDIHETIETFMILRAIASDDPLFQYRDSTYTGKPIMYEARKEFEAYRNHKAVQETQVMLNATSFTGDLIFQGLLYYEEFPSKERNYEISSEFWKSRKDSLDGFINLLHDFYVEANVGEFIANHSDFYEGAIAEASSHLADDLIPSTEAYFGIENDAYKMILIPSSPFGMGFGASVQSNNSSVFYQIISPANETEWIADASYEEYGFSGEGADAYYRELVVHEFCHPFITPFIDSEKWRSEINKSDSLYVPELHEKMKSQGYNSWWGFVNELLVRTAELRIAKQMKVEDLEAMREENAEEYGFVLLPEFEERMRSYEDNRDKYPTIHAFIPELIEQFAQYDRKYIRDKLKESSTSEKNDQ